MTISDGVGEGGVGSIGEGTHTENDEACKERGECVSEPTMAAEKYDGGEEGGEWCRFCRDMRYG